MNELIANACGTLLTERYQPMRECAGALHASTRTFGISYGMSSTPSASSPSEWNSCPGANTELIGGDAIRCRHATSLPFASSPASSRCIDTVCGYPFRMSSSRVHTTFTGAPISFDSQAASAT